MVGQWRRLSPCGRKALLLSIGLLFGVSAQAQDDSSAWSMQCEALGPRKTICTLSQQHVREDGAVLLIARFVGLESGAVPDLELMVPLSVWLPGGVTLSTASGPDINYEFDHCNQSGCVAIIPVARDIGDYYEGDELRVSYTLGGAGETLAQFRLPLAGLRAGVQAISEEAAEGGGE